MAERAILNVILIGSLSFVVLVVPAISAGTTIYVDDDSPANFHTIQDAIDNSKSGDIIIVGPGLYTGDGNRNIDFKGKAITVRSADSEDNSCMRKTVIDAQGRGVIVRFVNDEGSDSVFEGFTLVAGDTSNPVRGVPGFFEFSEKARPTTRRLCIRGDATRDSFASASFARTSLLAEDHSPEEETPQAGPQYNGRVWNGNNPFYQPAATTDYYGSGDVDNDGHLTAADVSLAQEIADGLRPPNIRADVDGNGNVNSVDVSLINRALDGDVLPGWWNRLTDRVQRNAWVTNFIRIEQTDKHLYYSDWFVCVDFANQAHIHGAFYREDLFGTMYDGGPTVFNLPIYCVGIHSHAINAILVGDDPLDFDDWRFFEPQNDEDVQPGTWNMPYGAIVTISQFLPHPGERKVEFYVDETGWTLLEYDTELVLTRPEIVVEQPDNRPDLWNPRFVPSAQGSILFERSREDMSRTTDIHLAELPFLDPPDGSPLVGSSQYSRLLDICQGPDGTIHLLWTGKPDYVPGVFYGKLDLVSRSIFDPVRVSTGEPLVCMGRIIVTPHGEIHIFWLERDLGTQIERDLGTRGIFWTKLTGSSWQSEKIISLARQKYYDSDWQHWENRNLHRYYFDVAVSKDGDIVLVWSEPAGPTKRKLRQRCYDNGQWGNTIDIEAINPRGVELAADSNGIFHLIYWYRSFEERGSLIHHTSEDGYTWSVPQVVDANGSAACPRMVPGDHGEVYLVWERKVGNQVVPVWTKYESGLWYTPQQMEAHPGYDSRYPTLDLLSNGTFMIAWSSQSNDRVTIETRTPNVIGDFDTNELLTFPVHFPDPKLQEVIEQALGISNPLTAHLLALSTLNASFGGTGDPDAGYEGGGIADLTGLEFATNMRVLFLYENEISDITALSRLTNLVELSLNYNQIHDIVAISGLTNLVDLSLSNNQIVDVSVLSKLTHLSYLNLEKNQISDISALLGLNNLSRLNLRFNRINDISPIFGLTNLTYLNLRGNQINDISALSKLTQLTDLSLEKNQITDISALSGLRNLIRLSLYNNPLNTEAYETYIPLIQMNNPGISLYYDPAP